MMMVEEFEDCYEHIDSTLLYTPVNIPGRGCDDALFEYQLLHKCACADHCLISKKCYCSTLHGANYVNGKLAESTLQGKHNGCIIECNSSCTCRPNCGNRLVQYGPNTNLKIVQFSGKGYGLICMKELRKGDFVCEYAGEVIGANEAIERRKNDSSNYIFTLNEYFDNVAEKTIIDATCISNIGRYINHSCDPNCKIIPVRVDSAVPKLAIFTVRDIKPMEEITYSYGEEIPSDVESSVVRKPCLCGANNCKLFLPYNI